MLWEQFKPKRLKLLPGALIAVVVAKAIATAMHLPIQYVDVPANLLDTLRFPAPSKLFGLIHAPLILEAIA